MWKTTCAACVVWNPLVFKDNSDIFGETSFHLLKPFFIFTSELNVCNHSLSLQVSFVKLCVLICPLHLHILLVFVL